MVVEYPHPFRIHLQFLFDIIAGLGIPIPPLLITNESIATLQPFPHHPNLCSSPVALSDSAMKSNHPFVVLVIKWFFPVKNILEVIMFFFPYICMYLTAQQVINQMMTFPTRVIETAMAKE